MCFYDRVRYTCGKNVSHTVWSSFQRFCEDAVESEEECGTKRVHKHIYAGWKCPQCNPYFDTIPPVKQPAKKPLPPQPCVVADCFLLSGHVLPHQTWTTCPDDSCHLAEGHDGPHHHGRIVDSRTISIQSEEIRKQREQQFQMLNVLVLAAMGVSAALRSVDFPPMRSSATATSTPDPQNQMPPAPLRQYVENNYAPAIKQIRPRQRFAECEAMSTRPNQMYLDLDLRHREIRLFELFPMTDEGDVQGTFRTARLSESLSYTALSYTWGDETQNRKITVGTIDGTETLNVRRNLWEFLRQQSSVISRPKVLWIDALCINQSNVHERNHQVNLMKDIYTEADEVYIWLGTKSANSDIAMDYMETKGTRNLRLRGHGYHRVWTREEGRALRDLCERPYWRRMWVIQEIVHARSITVWCGAKSFTWDVVESLYLTLKTLEDTHWFPHHEFAIQVLQSSAAVMVWQRAHWRHPDTPKPSLRTLIEVFRDWQCSDIRDKVFALVGMASRKTAIVPDYALPPRDLYFAVRKRHLEEGDGFENMLSQVLGLSDREVKLTGRSL